MSTTNETPNPATLTDLWRRLDDGLPVIGIGRRDMFAGFALAGMLAGQKLQPPNVAILETIKDAYVIADTMEAHADLGEEEAEIFFENATGNRRRKQERGFA